MHYFPPLYERYHQGMDRYSERYLDNVPHSKNLPVGDYYLVHYILSPNGYNAWSLHGSFEVIEEHAEGSWNDPYGRWFTNKSDAQEFLKSVKIEHEELILKKMLRDINTASRALKKRQLDGSGRVQRSIDDINKILNNLLPC